jgi:hypothetical protein
VPASADTASGEAVSPASGDCVASSVSASGLVTRTTSNKSTVELTYLLCHKYADNTSKSEVAKQNACAFSVSVLTYW